MIRIGLLLLACLLLALRTVAQAPEKAAPDDLVVTAEIVGYSHKLAESSGSKPQLILYVRLNVRNQTNHPREITFYSCGWEFSWIQRGAVSFDSWGCNKNYLRTLSIPANQSIVFYGPVLVRENGAEPTTFSLGFVDFTAADFESKAFRKYKRKWWDKLLASKAVYWSNTLNSEIDFAAIKEVAKPYPTYHLTWDDE